MAAPPLTVTQLFTPASSGVGSTGAVPLSPPDGTWLYSELYVAQKVHLPTTAWQPGGFERSLLAINAVMLSVDDAYISRMAQGAFLDSAATGSVTYQALNGQTITVAVTPDPSNPAQNPTGALGFLDLTCQGVYSSVRLSATYASGQLAIVNTGTSSLGPYAAGTYHVANPSAQGPATYANQSSLTIPSSIIAGGVGTVTGVTPGLTSTVLTTQGSTGVAVGQSIFVSVPVTSGITGLSGAGNVDGIFAVVQSVSSNIIGIAVGSSGAYTGGANGGRVYICTSATFQADQIGTASNAAPGAVTQTITQASGAFVSNIAAWSASNWESNVAYAARTRLSLAAASPNGPSQAYVYFAETAQQLLSDETPAVTLTNGAVIANEFANPNTGIVTTVVASTTPVSTTLGAAVTPGSAQNQVTGATNASPIVVTTALPHGIPGTIGTVTVAGVLGNLAANGTYTATVVTGTTVSLNGTTGSGAYAGGGNVEAGDLGQIDQLLQQNVTPDGIAGSVTVSALAFPQRVLGTVIVPQANVTAYQLAFLPAIQAYLSSLPIGGLFPNETVPVEYAQITGALITAGILASGTESVVRALQGVTLNGGSADVPFPSNLYQALLDPSTSISVIGV